MRRAYAIRPYIFNMAFNSEIHRRRSVRLKGYDYGQAGAYFITICTQHRSHLFGDILDGEMMLSPFGQIAYQEWSNTPMVRPNVSLDVFVVMPNHMHGIILIHSSDISQTDELQSGQIEKGVYDTPLPLKSPANTIGAIIRGYKGAVTRQINRLLPEDEKIEVWQRNYHEHIIRNERSYRKISDYILHNPQKWEADVFYNL
jgi:putative transposase